MYGTIENHHLKGKGNHGVPLCPVQGVPTGKPSKRNKKDENVIGKDPLFSDLNARPVPTRPLTEGLSDDEIRQWARLMVDATRKFTGNIDSWKFGKEDSLQNLILRCANRLKDRARVDLIDVFRNGEKKLELDLKRSIETKGNIYCIYLKPLFRMKRRNGLLFDVLLSFLKGLPFDSIFDTFEDRIDWIWTFLFEEFDSFKEDSNKSYREGLKSTIDFMSRYGTKYNGYPARDWKSLLENYRPRKKGYQRLKELLLASEKVDFQVVHRISLRDGYESMVDFYHTFLITDHHASCFTHSYIDMLNDYSNEYDLISTFIHVTVGEDGIGDFEEGAEHKLREVENFICELNELIEQI